MLKKLAMELNVANYNNETISYVDLAKKYGVYPGGIKRDIRYIRSLQRTLGVNPRKYFDNNCRDLNPKEVMFRCDLLQNVAFQKNAKAIYELWRIDYMNAKGVL